MKHEDNSFTYQGADLMEFEEAVTFFKANHPQYSDLVQASPRDSLATQETNLLSQAWTILATQRLLSHPLHTLLLLNSFRYNLKSP